MSKINYEQLKYRRQYIVTNASVNCPFSCNIVKLIKGYSLLYHTDLMFTKVRKSDKSLFLLGDIYDYKQPEYSNYNILTDLILSSFNTILERVSSMAGRFVLIYMDHKEIKLFHDASASRKIFYTLKNQAVICSSNQHLLAKVAGCEKTTEPSLIEFYQSNEFTNEYYSNIGHYTYYTEIKQLLPNHFLNLTSNEVKRYWPNRKLVQMSAEECITKSANMIKGFITAASKRYPLMLPVTSGYDSRTLLAATKDIKDQVYYYLNNTNAVKNSGDRWVPGKILKESQLMLHLLNIEAIQDQKFIEIYYNNNPFANKEFMPVIYNYLINFPEKLNLPANVIPVIKGILKCPSKKINGSILAKLRHLDKFDIAVRFYDEWLNECHSLCTQHGIDVCDLLYWEDRNCNWAMQILQDKDIAQEEFVPFNSRQLLSTMLAYDHRRRQKPHYELHKAIVKTLWPELLKYPFNPSRNILKNTLKAMRIYYPLVKVKKKLIGQL